MSIDYYVHFGERKPTMREIRYVVEDFVGRERVTWGEPRADDTLIYASLPESTSHAMTRVVDEEMQKWMGWIQALAGGTIRRGFAIYLFDDRVSFVLRGQDEYVQAVVRGIGEVIARYWGGKLELPS